MKKGMTVTKSMCSQLMSNVTLEKIDHFQDKLLTCPLTVY